MTQKPAALTCAAMLATLSAGCLPSVDVDVSIDRQIVVSGESSNLDALDLVQLFKESSELQQHREEVESMTVTSVVGTVTSIGDTNKATKVSGSITFAGAPGADITDMALQPAAHATGGMNEALDTAFLAAARSDGQLPVVVHGTADVTPVSFVIDLHVTAVATVKGSFTDL